MLHLVNTRVKSRHVTLLICNKPTIFRSILYIKTIHSSSPKCMSSCSMCSNRLKSISVQNYIDKISLNVNVYILVQIFKKGQHLHPNHQNSAEYLKVYRFHQIQVGFLQICDVALHICYLTNVEVKTVT